jgi:hypothetical protein
MTISTLSPKNQTTLGIDLIRQLNLPAGSRFRHWIEDGKIVLEPIPDADSAYGSLKPKRPFVSIEDETAGMERAVGQEIGRNLP